MNEGGSTQWPPHTSRKELNTTQHTSPRHRVLIFLGTLIPQSSAMAAADVSDKTGDEIAQELLLADIALGQRMQAKQLLHQLQCSADLVPVKAPLEEQLRKLIEARGQSCIAATTPMP